MEGILEQISKERCAGQAECHWCWSSKGLALLRSAKFEKAIPFLELAKPPLTSHSTIAYSPLPTDSTIRLLNIEPEVDFRKRLVCTLEDLDLSATAGYSGFSALSYQWGQDEPIYPITLNGERSFIRRNLWDFLMQARDNGWTARIWVDAICINQSDPQEKSSQVARMGEIYSRASNVLVWLGMLSPAEKQALFELDMLHDEIEFRTQAGSRHRLYGRFSEQVKTGIRSLVCNSYWTRKWIIQEITLSGANASLVVGDGYMSLHRVRACLMTNEMMSGDHEFRSAYDSIKYLLPDGSMTIGAMSLGELVRKYREHQCSDPRDHVYALLGLSGLENLRVDYTKGLPQLYWEVLQHVSKSSQYAVQIGIFATVLQETIGLSDHEILREWKELVRGGDINDLWGIQFVQAMQLSIGRLSSIQTWSKNPSTWEHMNLQSFQLNYAQLKSSNAHNTTTNGDWVLDMSAQRDSLMTLFQHVQSQHPSTLNDPVTSFCRPGLGYYFIGGVEDLSFSLEGIYRTQYQAYKDGSSLIPFTSEELFGYGTSKYSQYSEDSLASYIPLAALRLSDADLPLARDDLVCTFSKHQAALVIRRASFERAICGTAVIRFKWSNWYERILAAGKRMKVAKGNLKDGKLGQYFVPPFQLYMRPHCILHIQNWTAKLGQPFLPLIEDHSMCKH